MAALTSGLVVAVAESASGARIVFTVVTLFRDFGDAFLAGLLHTSQPAPKQNMHESFTLRGIAE